MRIHCRRYFKTNNVLERIPEDIQWIFGIDADEEEDANYEDPADLWDDTMGTVEGGKNHGHGGD